MLSTTALLPLALLLPQAEQRAEPTKSPAPTHVALGAGLGVDVVGRADARLGVFTDVVLAREDGAITHAILSVDGKRAIVADPFTTFRWDAEHDAWRAPATTAADTAEWPAFPAGGLDEFLAEHRPVPAGAERVGGQTLPTHLLATELLGQAAFLTGDPLGSIADLVVSNQHHAVEFVVLRSAQEPDADPCVAPWAAITHDGEGRATLNLGRLGMAEAPRLEGGKTRALLDPEFRTAVYSFYGLRAPRAAKKQTPSANS